MIQERSSDAPGAFEGSREEGRIPPNPQTGDSPGSKARWGFLNRQRRAVMEELGSVADVMRGAATHLEKTQEGELGVYVRKAANYVEGLSSSLGEHDLEELLHQTETSVRERPALTFGLTAGVGFVIGRFLKARSQQKLSPVPAREGQTQSGAR